MNVAATQKANKAPAGKEKKATTKDKPETKKASPAKPEKAKAESNTNDTKPAAEAKAKEGWTEEFGAKFGRASIGKGSVSIPAGIDRAALSVSQADKLFCCKRFAGTIHISNANGDQQPLSGMETAAELSGIFEVKGFAVKRTHISLTLNLSYSDKDASVIPVVANHDGKLQIVGPVEDIPDDE